MNVQTNDRITFGNTSCKIAVMTMLQIIAYMTAEMTELNYSTRFS